LVKIVPAAKAGVKKMDDAAYLRAVCWSPFDDGPRLVWADALDERGECARAEFVRVQCELARLYPGWSGEPAPDSLGAGGPYAELRRRERELLNQSGWGAWVPDLPGLAWRLNDDPLCQHDLAFLGCTFRRGLVESVTLTCRQFFGGPCESCGGRGYTLPGADSFLVERKGCSACGGNNWKDGTGRVEGVAAALFRAAPITEVRLSDREPDAISDGRLAWWYTDPDWHRPGLYQHHWLPVELRPHLTGRICEPIDEPRPGVCGFDYGNSFAGTDGVGLARADLSTACVAVGRDRAGLPTLARPVSADDDMPPRAPVHDVVNHPGGDRE
jgi:uncharacterized protein (TIGR02996 family)